jgi:hypothetical protein
LPTSTPMFLVPNGRFRYRGRKRKEPTFQTGPLATKSINGLGLRDDERTSDTANRLRATDRSKGRAAQAIDAAQMATNPTRSRWLILTQSRATRNDHRRRKPNRASLHGLAPADRVAFRRAAENALATSPQCLGPGSIYRTVHSIWREYFHPPTFEGRTTPWVQGRKPSKLLAEPPLAPVRDRRRIRIVR